MSAELWIWRPILAGKVTLREVKDGVATAEDLQALNALLKSCEAVASGRPRQEAVQALEQAEQSNRVVTDESSAMEALGLSPKLVRGSALNLKITYPEDFALAEAILLSRQG